MLKVDMELVGANEFYADVDMYVRRQKDEWLCRASLDRESGVSRLGEPRFSFEGSDFVDLDKTVPAEVLDAFKRAFPRAKRLMGAE
jgi:hypothetical protein